MNHSILSYKLYTSILTYEHNYTIKGVNGPYSDKGFLPDPGEEAEQRLEDNDFLERFMLARAPYNRPRRNAKVSYFMEKPDAKLKAQYDSLGYVDLIAKAESRFLTPQQELSKASFYKNRHTNVIIFILDDACLYSSTWGAIYNALVNNKTVMIRHNNNTFRKVLMDTKEFHYLSALFNEARVTRGIQYSQKQMLSIQKERLTQFENHELTHDKLALADTLAPLWELEPANNEYEYQVLMETINTYIAAQIPTEPIFVGDLEEEDNPYNSHGRQIIKNLTMLPMNLRKSLQPLLNIKETTIESFGNEDLFEATLLGTAGGA